MESHSWDDGSSGSRRATSRTWVRGGSGGGRDGLPPLGWVAPQSKDGRPGLLAAITPSLGMQVPEFFQWPQGEGSSFERENLPPEPHVGGGGRGERSWGFLSPHPGRSDCRAARRQARVSKTTVDGERHESSWAPSGDCGHFPGSLAGLAKSASLSSNTGGVVALEMVESRGLGR